MNELSDDEKTDTGTLLCTLPKQKDNNFNIYVTCPQMKRKIKVTQACAFVAQQAQHLVKKNKKIGPTGPSRIEEKRNEKRDIPVKNGIPQIRTDKCSTVFDPAPGSLRPVSVYPGKNENGREKTVYDCGRNGIHPVRFHL
jgi:hypothetical protein